jgi:hypothetical protein
MHTNNPYEPRDYADEECEWGDGPWYDDPVVIATGVTVTFFVLSKLLEWMVS